ncbi:hypothetical protein DBV15_08083 [Temnothorax longispinosus]|uniref:Uncharacterized protein n=1 Tax=Temnothorax longispinosus TaxID=300112 RepID=A0A4S2JSJ1_9HYME|nr:hypothetical protein DBV15_08083 [Temnothorax longispinosus]
MRGVTGAPESAKGDKFGFSLARERTAQERNFQLFDHPAKLNATEWCARRIFVGNWQFRRLLLVRAIIRLEEELTKAITARKLWPRDTVDVHVRSKAPYLLEIIDHRSGERSEWPGVSGRIRKNVLRYRKLLPEAGGEGGEGRGCVLSVKRLFSVDVADVAHPSPSLVLILPRRKQGRNYCCELAPPCRKLLPTPSRRLGGRNLRAKIITLMLQRGGGEIRINTPRENTAAAFFVGTFHFAEVTDFLAHASRGLLAFRKREEEPRDERGGGKESKRGVSVHRPSAILRLVGISWDARIERASRAIEHEVSRRPEYGERERIRRDGRSRPGRVAIRLTATYREKPTGCERGGAKVRRGREHRRGMREESKEARASMVGSKSREDRRTVEGIGEASEGVAAGTTMRWGRMPRVKIDVERSSNGKTGTGNEKGGEGDGGAGGLSRVTSEEDLALRRQRKKTQLLYGDARVKRSEVSPGWSRIYGGDRNSYLAVSVYFSLELPISEENRSIHDNFTGSSTEPPYFPARRKRLASVGIVVAPRLCEIIRDGTRERGTECNRTHKENPLRSRGELSIKLPTGGNGRSNNCFLAATAATAAAVVAARRGRRHRRGRRIAIRGPFFTVDIRPAGHLILRTRESELKSGRQMNDEHKSRTDALAVARRVVRPGRIRGRIHN